MSLMKDITICLSLSPIVMLEQSCIDGINKFTNKLIEKHGYSGGAFLHGPNSHPKRFSTEEMKAFFAIHEAQLLQFRHHTQSPRANVSPISVRGRQIRSRTTTPRRRRSRSHTPASNESTTTPEENDFRLARRHHSQSRTPASIESTIPHVTRCDVELFLQQT